MIKEIYTRNPSDPNYVYGVFEHSNPIESIITKIKMILGTNQGSVMGDVGFGVGIEDLIFMTNINGKKLEEKIVSQIQNYIIEAGKYSIVPKIIFGQDNGQDYCVIDIYINNNKEVGILVK